MDLAKRELRGTSLPQKTFRRDTTMPRQDTDAPRREINAKITRPDTSGSEELSRILGLANQVGQNALGDVQERKNQENAGAAALDFANDHKDDQRFAKSRAYRDAWQLEGAKKLSLDVGNEATQAVNDRLNDSDNPATPEEIDALIEGVFQKHTTDSSGKLLDFGTPQAKMTLGHALMEVRSSLIPQAMAAIKKQTDARFLTTWADNSVHEFYRGAPIGAPMSVKVTPEADPLAPLDLNPDTTKPYYVGALKVPIDPFRGFRGEKPSSVMGASREGGSVHNGEDFPLPSGTKLVSPMQGTVVSSFSNARGGNQVRIRMADGAIIGMAHLSSRSVKAGDVVEAGQTLGLSGATGHATGPHVHMTVEVDGKKVSPRTYFASAKVPSGLPSGPASAVAGPELATSLASAPQQQLAPFNFESAMKAVPPGISKGDAKTFLLQSLFNEARGRGDTSLLAGLEESTRKDGTPSFNPKEIETIQANRDQISENTRAKADRARHDLWEKNTDTLFNALMSDNPPSEGFIRQAAQDGRIDPNVAYSIIREQRNEVKSEEREARFDARQADAESNAIFDDYISSLVSQRETGDLQGASPDSDRQLLDSGKLGSGLKALTRFQKLRSAQSVGERQNLSNPDYSRFAGELRMKYGQKSHTFLEKAMGSGGTNFYGMLGYYKSLVGTGKAPAEAYQEAVLKFAPKSADAFAVRQQRIEELRARRAGAGR